jgi:hypothetical protein
MHNDSAVLEATGVAGARWPFLVCHRQSGHYPKNGFSPDSRRTAQNTEIGKTLLGEGRGLNTPIVIYPQYWEVMNYQTPRCRDSLRSPMPRSGKRGVKSYRLRVQKGIRD